MSCFLISSRVLVGRCTVMISCEERSYGFPSARGISLSAPLLPLRNKIKRSNQVGGVHFLPLESIFGLRQSLVCVVRFTVQSGVDVCSQHLATVTRLLYAQRAGRKSSSCFRASFFSSAGLCGVEVLLASLPPGLVFGWIERRSFFPTCAGSRIGFCGM